MILISNRKVYLKVSSAEGSPRLSVMVKIKVPDGIIIS